MPQQRVSIRNAHNDLLTALDAVELAYKRRPGKSRLDTLKIKFDAGCYKSQGYNDTELNLLSQQQAILDGVRF